MNREVAEHFSLRQRSVGGKAHQWLKSWEAAALFKMIGPVQGLRVLDLGCGDGHYAREFVRRGASDVLGYDFSLSQVVEQGPLHLSPGDIELTDWDLNGRDLILALGVLEFLDDPVVFLRRISQTLALGARFVLLYPPPGLFSDIYRRYHRRHGFEIQSFPIDQVQQTLAELKLIDGRTIHPYARLEVYGRR